MNPTKETLNILQQFNKCSDNKLTIENINYLDNLYSVISNSISYISEFNINSIKFIQIKSLHNNDIGCLYLVILLQYISTLHFQSYNF